MSKKYGPKTVKVYFRCQFCGTEHDYFTERARKFCSRKCQNAAYYRKRVPRKESQDG